MPYKQAAHTEKHKYDRDRDHFRLWIISTSASLS